MKIKTIGFFTIILGIFSMMMPWFTGFSILFAIGILVLSGGIARLFWAFQADSFAKGALRFVLGSLTLLFGIYLIVNPKFASGLLTIIIAIYFLFDGITELVTGVQLRNEGGNWWIFGGILSIFLAFMIWSQFPLSGLRAVGILIGMKLIFAGIVMVMAGKLVGSISKEL